MSCVGSVANLTSDARLNICMSVQRLQHRGSAVKPSMSQAWCGTLTAEMEFASHGEFQLHVVEPILYFRWTYAWNLQTYQEAGRAYEQLKTRFRPRSLLQITDMRGMRALELGCGTAYVSAWMARRGAVVTGIDNSEAQLRTAARLAGEHGIAIELIHGNAEMVPAEDGSFDYTVSEYGAAIWCDPYKWIPEAHRLLRTGGELAFLGTHPLAMACTPPNGDPSEDRLHRPWFGMHSFDFRAVEVDPGGMEFNLGTGEWVRLFSDTGFRVLSYRELRAPESASEDRFGLPVAWARKWPAEQVWHLRKE